ncbi:MAG TPA: hypothetical protein DCY20_03995 [Firmicutes bacterium]|nr:hypothetical protein [Bacillota bacterium]
MNFHQEIKNIALILMGSFILAFGLFNFNYQHQITEGGVLGFILLTKVLFNISPAMMSLLLDTSLFLLGVKFFGHKFMVYSLIATFSFSIFYGWNEHMGFIIPNLNDHMLFATILAGLFVGVGVGLIVKTGGAAGGDDVVALIVGNHTSLSVGHVYLIMDSLVLLLSLTYLTVDEVFYSILAVMISGRLINYIYYKKEAPDLSGV